MITLLHASNTASLAVDRTDAYRMPCELTNKYIYPLKYAKRGAHRFPNGASPTYETINQNKTTEKTVTRGGQRCRCGLT